MSVALPLLASWCSDSPGRVTRILRGVCKPLPVPTALFAYPSGAACRNGRVLACLAMESRNDWVLRLVSWEFSYF